MVFIKKKRHLHTYGSGKLSGPVMILGGFFCGFVGLSTVFFNRPHLFVWNLYMPPSFRLCDRIE